MASFNPLTQNYQFAFGDGTGSTQWVFGGPGAGVQVLQVDGLEGLPNLRTQDANRGYMDGSFSGRDFVDARVVTFQLQIMSDNTNSMQTYLAELQQYLMPQRSGMNVLQMYLPGGRGVRRLYGRVRKRQILIDPQYVYGRALATLEFYCPDPRIYNDTAASYTINSLSSSSRTYNRQYGYSTTSNTIGTGSKTFTVPAGLGYLSGQAVTAQSQGTPSAYMIGTITSYSSTTLVVNIPSTAGSTGGSGTFTDWAILGPTYPTAVSGSSGSQSVTNVGNYETWPTFSISTSSTSCSGIIVSNYTTGDVLSFPNLTLGASDTLVLDSDLRTVLINGSPARNTMSVASRWFPLPPATKQIIGLSAATGTALCTISYRDAYI